MNFDERCAAVAKLGFTERQARFLTTVMLHTGVCVPRQYARYCRIVHGQKTRKFFAKLVRLGYASMYDCRHNRAQLYHMNKRSLYAAIGQATSRLHRPLPLSQAIHRLMVLDAIVEDPEMVWLGTVEDKAAHLTALTGITPEELPHMTSGIGERRTVRYFPDRLPIGIHLAGRGVLVYVLSAPDLNDFRVFVERHAALLRALPAWTLRIVAPPEFPGFGERAKKIFETHLMAPLSPAAIDEIRWYFEQLRASAPSDVVRFVKDRRAFATPPLQLLYGRWKQDGEAALVSICSSALRHAVEAGRGHVEVLELGHRYGHLSPLAAVS